MLLLFVPLFAKKRATFFEEDTALHNAEWIHPPKTRTSTLYLRRHKFVAVVTTRRPQPTIIYTFIDALLHYLKQES